MRRRIIPLAALAALVLATRRHAPERAEARWQRREHELHEIARFLYGATP